MQKSNLLLK